MTKNYYRNEYTEQQWIALINKAIEFGCKVTYSIYGNIAEIDSTDLEIAIIIENPNHTNTSRGVWADEIHGQIQDAAERVK